MNNLITLFFLSLTISCSGLFANRYKAIDNSGREVKLIVYKKDFKIIDKKSNEEMGEFSYKNKTITSDRKLIKEFTTKRKYGCIYTGFCYGIGFNGKFTYGFHATCRGNKTNVVKVKEYNVIDTLHLDDITFTLPERKEEDVKNLKVGKCK